MKTEWNKSILLQCTCVHCTLKISDLMIRGKKETSLHPSRSDNTIYMTMKRRKQWIGRSNMEDVIYFSYLLWEVWILVLFNPVQKPKMGWDGVFALPSFLFKLRTRLKVNIPVNPCWDPILITAVPHVSACHLMQMFSNLPICGYVSA